MSVLPQNVGVVLVNWNCARDTTATANFMAGLGYLVTVVDNGSCIPGEVSNLRSNLADGVVLLEREFNGGFGAGMNTGMKELVARGLEFAILLNPDISPSERVFDAILNALGSDVDVVGIAQATEVDGAAPVPYQSAAVLRRAKPLPLPSGLEDGNVVDADVVTGACVVVRLSKAKEVSFIDESYFHYKEEFDFVYRMKSSGCRVRFLTFPVLLHRNGSSLSTVSRQARYYHYRNEVLFLRKNFGMLEIFRMPVILKSASFEIVSGRDWGLATAIVRGLGHGLRGLDGKYQIM